MTDREIVTTRLVDATRERVFEAFRDPARLSRWWGPTGFTSTFHEFDLRPGGTWRFILHGPDGASFGANEQNLDRLEADLARTERRRGG